MNNYLLQKNRIAFSHSFFAVVSLFVKSFGLLLETLDFICEPWKNLCKVGFQFRNVAHFGSIEHEKFCASLVLASTVVCRTYVQKKRRIPSEGCRNRVSTSLFRIMETNNQDGHGTVDGRSREGERLSCSLGFQELRFYIRRYAVHSLAIPSIAQQIPWHMETISSFLNADGTL